MVRRRDLRAGLSIAHVELRRSLRTVLGDRRRVASGLVVAAVVALPYLGILGTAHAAGARVAAGEDGVATALRGAFPAAVGGLILLATVQRVAESSVPDGAELLLTAARTPAVVLGELLSATATLYATLAVLLGPGLVAFALGASSPATVPLALAMALPVVTFAATVGYLLALSGAVLGRRLPHVTGLKFGAYVGGMVLVGLSGPLVAEYAESGASGPIERVAAVPVADYAPLALVGTPAGVVTPAGVATGLGLCLVTVGGVLAAPRLAAHLWFTDVGGDDGAVAERYAAVPRAFAGTPSLRVAWRYLLLARRAPRRLVHLTVFLFMLFPLTGVVVAEPGAIPAVASGTALVFGALLSGAAFGLNPLGDEGDVLPGLIVTGVGGRRLVRGRLLAGLSVGLPLALVGAVGLWLSLALDARVGLGLLAGVGPVAVAAGCVALGMGAAVPKFESEEIFGVETVHPSRIPLLLYVYGGLVAVPLGLALVALPLDTVDRSLHLAALGAYAVVVGGVAVGSYVYAVRRVDRHAE